MAQKLDQHFGETCAPLVLDSTGFTRITKSHSLLFFLSIIQKLREVSTKIFQDEGALSWRSYADNMFAEFKTVDSAVTAAFAIHHYFSANPLCFNGITDTFGVCIGIGFGRVLRSDFEGVYGDQMNYASKLGEDIAEQGQTLLTEAAFKQLSKPGRFLVTQNKLKISGVDLPIFDISPKTW